MSWIVYIGILVLVMTFILYLRTKKNSEKIKQSKVVKLSSNRSKSKYQACTYCRKKFNRLSFYSDEQGKVIGLCDACKPRAEKRQLFQL